MEILASIGGQKVRLALLCRPPVLEPTADEALNHVFVARESRHVYILQSVQLAGIIVVLKFASRLYDIAATGKRPKSDHRAEWNMICSMFVFIECMLRPLA